MELDTSEQAPMGMSADSTDEATALGEYRSISPIALIGLVAGLLTPLVFLTDVLISLPLVAAAICIIALVKIQASEGRLVGRNFAMIGLVISVISLCGAFSQAQTVRFLLGRQAKVTAEEWFQLLATDKLERAFLLTSESQQAPASPKGPPINLGGKALPPLEKFRADQLISALLSLPDEVKIELLETAALDRPPKRNQIYQLYRITPKDSSEASIEAGLMLEQSTAGLEPSPWRIRNYSLAKE